MSRKLIPKKRTSAEANDEEQTNEDSDGVIQQEDNAKRARLASLSDTTLQDLPNELLECILVKVVAMEVKDLKLIKSVWKDKADLVINRLKPVSSHWTSILSTNSFRCKLDRTLDGTAELTISLELLYESTTHTPQPSLFNFVTSLKDEIFMVEQPGGEAFVIKVYGRDNMAKVKDVIPLDAQPEFMAACKVSNCVYVGLNYNEDFILSVVRISKDGDNQFNVSPWTMNDPERSVYMINVPGDGNLLIRPRQQTGKDRNVVRICDANGCLQREVMLPGDIPGLKQKTHDVITVLQKSNGNVVMVYSGDYPGYTTNLLELDANGSVVRRCESQIVAGSVNFADIHGRILITDNRGSMELLDPEFNLIGVYAFQQDEGKDMIITDVSFTRERNEIMRTHFYCSPTYAAEVFTIFRFTDK